MMIRHRRSLHILGLSFLPLALCLAVPTRSAAGPIIQNVSNEARNISPWIGQTFTAEDVLIDIVGVYVTDFTFGTVATDSTIEYRLYEGVGTGGTLLGSRTFSGLVEGFHGFADVSFAGIPLVVGTTYSLIVSNDTGQWGVESAFSSGGTYYTGGTALLPPDGSPGIPPRDLRFHVLPAVPCVYAFAAASGASFVKFCVSENGTLVELQAPAGQEHVDVGQAWEGYIVCTGTTAQSWDLSATADGFGATTLIAGPTSTGVTLRRSSVQYQLDQVFKLDKKEKDITITMTLTNVSRATIPDVRIARAYDPDVNTDFGDDLEVRSARGVWAGDVDAVTLTGTTWAVPTDTAVDTGSSPACSPTGAAAPRVTGDASLAAVTYRLGNMAPGAKKKVVFVYRVQ